MLPMLLLSLGCVRAGFLRRWDAIIFLDVSATMPFLLASQFAAELFEDVLVHGLERLEFVKFEPVGTFGACASSARFLHSSFHGRIVWQRLLRGDHSYCLDPDRIHRARLRLRS